MRFHFMKIEKFITETLQILFLTTIVGCTFSETHQQITAMDRVAVGAGAGSGLGTVATTKDNVLHTPTTLDTAAAANVTTSSTINTSAYSTIQTASLTFSSLSLASSATSSAPLQFSTTSATPTSVSAAAAAHLSSSSSSSSSATSLTNGYRRDALSRSNIFPTSDILNDSSDNDVDGNNGGDGNNDDDAHNTRTPQHNARRLHKFQDLSGFSLLSFNDTTASSLTLGHGGGGSGSNSNNSSGSNNKNSNNNGKNVANHSQSHATVATFLQIKSQKLALNNVETTTAAATAPGGSTHHAHNNSGGGGSGSHQHGSSSSSSNNNNKHNTKSSRDKVESRLVLPKPQKTDAPMLNYIFDMFSTANKHHHHDQRYGPHFEDVQRVGQPTNITVQAGGSVYLNCRISLLQDKTVSWVRRNAQGEDDALDLLTVGLHTYTGDKRYTMEFQYPNNWRLKIVNVKKDDEAMYECQISTHPPRVIQINLHVNAPKVMIVDEFGDPLQEKYYETDSTLQLSCIVRNVAMASAVVFWKHGDQILNYDITRGGVSVKTELMEDGANSTLFIAKISKSDSGNYTCSISDNQEFSIVVHILNGESFAELHHGGAKAAHVTCYATLAINLVLLIFLLCLPSYTHR